MIDTNEAMIAKRRVTNATRTAVNHSPELAQVGIQGAIAYALLDVANAIRDQGPDAKTQGLLRIADALVDAIRDGESEEQIKKIADAFYLESQGVSYDQKTALYFPKDR